MLEAAVDRLLDVAERAGVDRVRLELPGLGPKRTIAPEIAGVRLVGGGREIVERWRSIRRRPGHACDRPPHPGAPRQRRIALPGRTARPARPASGEIVTVLSRFGEDVSLAFQPHRYHIPFQA